MPDTQDDTIYIDFEYDIQDITTKDERNVIADEIIKAMHPGFSGLEIGVKVDIIDDANRAVIDLYQHFAEVILRQVLADQRRELKARAEQARDTEGLTGMVMSPEDWGEILDTVLIMGDTLSQSMEGVQALLYTLKEMSPVA